MALLLSVVTSRVLKWSINPMTNPNPIYSHTHTHGSVIRSNYEYVKLNYICNQLLICTTLLRVLFILPT
jgi:hypothetical protein